MNDMDRLYLVEYNINSKNILLHTSWNIEDFNERVKKNVEHVFSKEEPLSWIILGYSFTIDGCNDIIEEFRGVNDDG